MAQAEICARDLMQQVLVIQLPRGDRGEADLAAYRDYVVESLAQGVLILGSGTPGRWRLYLAWAGCRSSGIRGSSGPTASRSPSRSLSRPGQTRGGKRRRPWNGSSSTARRAVWAVWRWWPAGAAEISRRTSCGASSPEPRNYPLSSGGSSAGPWTSWRRVRMSKAIKHIKAGLLHIEVIGTVPDRPPGRQGRAARSQATSPAQQFYNDKCSWRELELVLAATFGRRPWS